MDIRAALEHSNYKAVDRGEPADRAISELSREYAVLLLCDVARRPSEKERESYVRALAAAEIISPDQIADVLAEDDLQIVIPLHTMRVATELYRRIPHASHFVTMWVDGKLYSC